MCTVSACETPATVDDLRVLSVYRVKYHRGVRASDVLEEADSGLGFEI